MFLFIGETFFFRKHCGDTMRVFSELEEREKVIVGWAELTKATGLSLHFLQREIGHYGFPKPRHFMVKHKTSHSLTRTKVWTEKEVEHWMATNKEKY